MPRICYFEEFNCDDCSDTGPCGEHEELAASMCEADGERGHKEEGL